MIIYVNIADKLNLDCFSLIIVQLLSVVGEALHFKYSFLLFMNILPV